MTADTHPAPQGNLDRLPPAEGDLPTTHPAPPEKPGHPPSPTDHHPTTTTHPTQPKNPRHPPSPEDHHPTATTHPASRGSVSAAEAAACRAEVVRHHKVIESWLTGRATRTDLDVFAAAHTPDFAYTTPDGQTLPLPHLLAMIEPAHGATPALSIEIHDVRVVAGADTMVVATYDEHHHGPDPRDRRATVVFVRDAAAPHGLRWRHLHETWI